MTFLHYATEPAGRVGTAVVSNYQGVSDDASGAPFVLSPLVFVFIYVIIFQV